MDDSTGIEASLDWSKAPQAINDVERWLRHGGFSVEGGMRTDQDNQLVVVRSGNLLVRVGADRGEWSIAVTLTQYDGWFHPDEWQAYVDGFPLAGDLSTLDHQSEFLRDRVFDVARELACDSGAEAVMRRRGEEYASRLLGLPLRRLDGS